MDQQPPQKLWWYIISAITLFIGFVFMMIYGITAPAIEASRLGQPLPTDWTWMSIVIWDLIFIAMGAILCWIVLVQACTVYTDEGISKPRPLGRTIVKWKEVSHVAKHYKFGYLRAIEVISPSARVLINVFVYRSPEQIVSYLKQYVPDSAEWHEVGRSAASKQ
jgi:hypothetical protein